MTHVYDHSEVSGNLPGILGKFVESGTGEDSAPVDNRLRTCDSSDSPSHASMHRYK
jgi:hypothetical protein